MARLRILCDMLQAREKIVVTGGAGFIGSHLVDRLLAETGAEVFVIDNLRRGRLANLAQHRDEPRLQFVSADIRDARTVSNVIAGAGVVYHLAAQSTVMGAVEDLEDSFSTNVTGTFNVLRAAARHKVPRLVFASSREVYGEPLELPVQEDHPLQAINFYGASKVFGEAYFRAFRRAYGLQSVVLRLSNVYGPRDFGRVVPLWVEQAAVGKDLFIYGGKQVIDFIWIDHVIEALARAARCEIVLPPINVGSGIGTRITDLARRVMLLVGGRSEVKVRPARAVEVVRYVAGVGRMRQLLELEPPLDPLEDLARLTPARVSALG